MSASFDLVFVGQSGRLQFEALLLAASLREMDPNFAGRVICAEPAPGGAWLHDPRMDHAGVRAELARLEVEILPFEAQHFGADYPHGNKIEALAALPEGRPFLFLDSDTLVLGKLSELSFDFAFPTASMRREGTWPEIELYGPGYNAIWGSLYDRFGLDFQSSLDLSQPDEFWQRYLYFNAGWIAGPCPATLGRQWLDMARSVRDAPPDELICQSLDPWLDQVTLPLAIHAQGGGRPGPALDGLDGNLTCHWRVMSLLFAREPDTVIEVLRKVTAPNRIKKALKDHEAFKRFVYQSKGEKVREMFDRADLPRPEAKIRKKLKNRGLWVR